MKHLGLAIILDALSNSHLATRTRKTGIVTGVRISRWQIACPNAYRGDTTSAFLLTGDLHRCYDYGKYVRLALMFSLNVGHLEKFLMAHQNSLYQFRRPPD